MDDFVKFLKENENYKTAKAIRDDMNKLESHLSLNFKKDFEKDKKHLPFQGVKMYHDNSFCFFEGYEVLDYTFNSDIKISDNKTTIDFSVRRPNEFCYTEEPPREVLKNLGSGIMEKFLWNGQRFVYEISRENVIISFEDAAKFMTEFLKLLQENQEKIKQQLKKM